MTSLATKSTRREWPGLVVADIEFDPHRLGEGRRNSSRWQSGSAFKFYRNQSRLRAR